LAKKNSWSPIFFSVKYTSIGSIRVHNPEYEEGVLNNFFIATGTSETLKKKNQKKIDKQNGYVQLKLTGFCAN
jgi:hypothetical protein